MDDLTELVEIYEEIGDAATQVDSICNRIFNRDIGFRLVSKRAGRNPTVYQTLANVQRNLSITAEAVRERIAELQPAEAETTTTEV